VTIRRWKPNLDDGEFIATYTYNRTTQTFIENVNSSVEIVDNLASITLEVSNESLGVKFAWSKNYGKGTYTIDIDYSYYTGRYLDTETNNYYPIAYIDS
jgi:hypothetical protein